MSVFLSFAKSFMSAAGAVAALVFGLIYVKKFIKKSTFFYEAEQLIAPFNLYLRKLRDEERYEEIAEVKDILKELRSGEIPRSVRKYKLEWDPEIITMDEQGNETVKFKKKIMVLGPKAKRLPAENALIPRQRKTIRLIRSVAATLLIAFTVYHFRQNIWQLFM